MLSFPFPFVTSITTPISPLKKRLAQLQIPTDLEALHIGVLQCSGTGNMILDYLRLPSFLPPTCNIVIVWCLSCVSSAVPPSLPVSLPPTTSPSTSHSLQTKKSLWNMAYKTRNSHNLYLLRNHYLYLMTVTRSQVGTRELRKKDLI